MKLDEAVTPQVTIEQKLAERSVLITEINALNKLRLSKKNTEFERKLAKEYYDYLQQKVLFCDKEIFRVFYEEIPVDALFRAKLLEDIEFSDVQLWTYKSDIKVLPNPITMAGEDYQTLSYKEKVELKIVEHNILIAGIKAIKTQSNTVETIEVKLRKARENELKRMLLVCIKELWRLDWDEIPRDDNNTHQKIKALNVTKVKYDSIFTSLVNQR